ncbi:MAG: amidohydrolase family protein [Actinomycetota bacterium]|nr:amidohydrolase family protein [Actinomycetota bacterium]
MERIKELLNRHQIPSIVDIHVHFMPENVLAKVRKYFDEAGPLLGRNWPIQYRDDDETRIQQLKDFGVTRFSALNYAHKAGMARWLNEWSRSFATTDPAIISSATLYPDDDAYEYTQEAIQGGAEVFKVHIQVGDFSPIDPKLNSSWNLLAETRIPIVIHAGSGPAPGRYTGAELVRQLLALHPNLTLVIAHMGMPEYSEFIELALKYENVYLDTTMVLTPFTEETTPLGQSNIETIADLSEKILFGSDFPNIPHEYVVALESLESAGFSSKWMRDVLFETPTRLLASRQK